MHRSIYELILIIYCIYIYIMYMYIYIYIYIYNRPIIAYIGPSPMYIYIDLRIHMLTLDSMRTTCTMSCRQYLVCIDVLLILLF